MPSRHPHRVTTAADPAANMTAVARPPRARTEVGEMGLRDRVRGGGGHRSQMREKLISIGDGDWIEAASGADPVLAMAITIAIDALAHDHG